MFKLGNFEEEIFKSMEKNLVSSQIENKYGFDKLAKATDYLNSAAEIFEKAGMYSEAAEITEVISELAAKLSKK